MCFSHVNRLPFRLKCLPGGVQWCCSCQRDVFDSLMSRVKFPSTFFWGKPWCFGDQWLSQQALYWFRCLLLHNGRTNPSLLLVQQNSFPYFLFRFPDASEKLEMRGIDPRTSRMQSERSTIWATSPLKNRGANAISNLFSVNAIVEQSFLLHVVVKLAMLMRVINPCVSHMPIACPFVWHASLVGSNGSVYFRGLSLIHLSVE